MRIEILDEIVFACPVCGRTFETFYGLRNHFQKAAKNYCPICGKVYRNVVGHYYHRSFRDEEHAILFGLVPTKQGKTNANKEKYKQYKEKCKRLAYERCKRKKAQLVLDNGKKYDILEAAIQNGRIVLHCYKRYAYAHLSHRIFKVKADNGIIEKLREAGVKIYNGEKELEFL